MAPENLLDRQSLKRIALGLALSACLILWIGEYTNLDIVLAETAYDPILGFVWRDAWLAEKFSHGIMKAVLLFAGMAIVFAAAWDAFRPFASWDGSRRLRMRCVTAAAILVPAITSLLKQASASHCPWDLAQFGGSQPYVRLIDALPSGMVAGHCLPAGHASSALWLVSLGVLWLPASRGTALLVSMAGLALGFALGWMQQLRGAHFLTHTLWSMWIACAVVALLAGVSDRGLAAYPRRQSA
jgi:membrane-associated PAP2 superfamily phosphatase